MSAIDPLADLFQAGDLAGLGVRVAETAAASARPVNEVIYDVYLALHGRGDRGQALNFIFSYCQSQADPAGLILYFGRRIHEENDPDIGANLLMALIANGGGDPYAFETCINYCVDKQMPDLALSTFQQYRDRCGLRSASLRTLFNVGSILLIKKDLDGAFALYQAALEIDPNFAPARANVLHLARGEGHPGAVAYIDQLSADIATEAPPPVAHPDPAHPDFLPSGPTPDFIVHWSGDEAKAIEAAIRAHGFCYLKGACSVEAVTALRRHAEALHEDGVAFPIPFTETVKAALDGVFTFDPRPVLDALSGPGFAIDHAVSVMRRVSIDRGASLVPFHQDSTAFQRALYNIWIPLTPAGGEYPSIQFVGKLINIAEQTKVSEGEYNRIEIDARFVMEKYGDLLHTVNDAQPGDCVIFYGTTIHRSFGLDTAVHPRFNIEVRWS